MKRFLVGGAVRDRFIPAPIKDHDWVWTGITPEVLEARGFKQVGADFPVFLDEKGEEHALARTERKTGPGYNGFETTFDPSITIEEDLLRRDLTINAMAMEAPIDHNFLDGGDDSVIDPFGGRQDIRDGILRHVSDAFREDPVRVLRVARFAARFNFTVHTDTMELMKDIVQAGEMDHLTVERVWSEMDRAIVEDYPTNFFRVLHECGALARIFNAEDDIILHELAGHIDQIEIPQKDGSLRLNLHALENVSDLGVKEDWIRWVAVLFTRSIAVGAQVLERMRAPNGLIDRLMQVEQLWRLRDHTNTQTTHDFMRRYRLNNLHHFEEYRETCTAMKLCGESNTSSVFYTLRAVRDARKVWADTIQSKYPQGEAPKGKELGEAIAEEQKRILRKYFNV